MQQDVQRLVLLEDLQQAEEQQRREAQELRRQELELAAMRAADREGEAWRACVREAAAAAKMEGTVTQAAQLELQDGVSDAKKLLGM